MHEYVNIIWTTLHTAENMHFPTYKILSPVNVFPLLRNLLRLVFCKFVIYFTECVDLYSYMKTYTYYFVSSSYLFKRLCTQQRIVSISKMQRLVKCFPTQSA